MFSKAVVGALVVLMLVVPAAATQRAVPHLTSPGGPFVSTLSLHNTSDHPQSYTLRPFSAEGVALQTIAGELAAGQTLRVASDELGGASHALLDGDLSAEMAYGSTDVDLVVPVTDGATSWVMQRDSWTRESGSLVVVNLGKNPTRVWLHQRNAKGDYLASVKLAAELGSNAKIRVNVSPDSFKNVADSHFEIIADQALSVLSLAVDGQGKLSLNPLERKRTAESARDEVGSWFITGGSLGDVFEMMGYNVATDRLWQSELFRRSAQGRLAELWGPAFVNMDIGVLNTGYTKEEYMAVFDAMTPEEQTIISSYAEGYNRRISEVHSDINELPFEFQFVGLTHIEAWEPWHSIAWAIVLQHNFTAAYGAGYQATAAAELQDLVARFGPIAGASMFNDLHWVLNPKAQVMVPERTQNAKPIKLEKAPLLKLLPGVPDFREMAIRMNEERENNQNLLKSIGAFVKGGSYAWVVAGSKTESGNPILYSGPQLEDPSRFSAPSVVQEGSIRGGGLNVSGLVMSGIPGIIVGRTPNHAWSFMVGNANDQDLYLESPNAIVSQRTVTIKVAGEADRTHVVAHTRRGPIVNANPLVSLKSATRNYEQSFLKALLGFARATNMDEFGQAASQLAVSMHICYADKNKNIAYWHTGRQPIRPHGSWILPQGAVAAPLEWDTTQIEPMVHDRNHPQGFYGGWNNVPTASYVDTSGSYLNGQLHRAHVITDYLAAHNNLDFDDVAAIAPYAAFTFGNGMPWNFFREFIKPVIEAHPTEARLAALELLEEFDGIAPTGPDYATSLDLKESFALQSRFFSRLSANTFQDELPPGPVWTAIGSGRLNVTLQLLSEDGLHKAYNWFRNRRGTGPDGFEAVVVKSMDEAIDSLGPRPWGVGARLGTIYNHALFSNMVPMIPELATPFSNRATYAQCIEVGSTGPIRIGTHFPLGQNGNIYVVNGQPVLTPSNFAQMPYWQSFTLRPYPIFD